LLIHASISKCGPAIKACGGAIGRQVGKVADATDVDDYAMNAGVAQYLVVKSGNQWCPLSPGSYVTATKIAHHGNVA